MILDRLKEYIPFYKRNLKIAIPVVLSQVGGAFVLLVDTYMVGKLGTTQLAAASFASSIFILGFVVSTGLLMGAIPLIGQAFVEGKHERVSKLFQNNFLLAFISSVLIMVLLFLIGLLMPYMGQDPVVVKCAKNYYTILIVSLFPFAIFCSFRHFLEGLGNTKVAMLITLSANLVNILFNYLLIYGKWGFPQMGLDGAGLATLISRVFMPIVFFFVIKQKQQWWSYMQRFTGSAFSKQTVKELFRVGFPISGHMLLECSTFAFSGIMIGWISKEALAANQITTNMANMTFMIVLGIAAATTIRVAHQYGVKDFKSLRMAANASIHLCLATNVLTAFFLIFFRNFIATSFSSDPAVINITTSLLILAGVFQLSDGLQAVGAGILRGLTDVKITLVYAIIAYLCLDLPLGYFFAFVCHLGAEGIWVAYIIGLSVAAFLFHKRYRKTYNRLQQEYLSQKNLKEVQ